MGSFMLSNPIRNMPTHTIPSHGYYIINKHVSSLAKSFKPEIGNHLRATHDLLCRTLILLRIVFEER